MQIIRYLCRASICLGFIFLILLIWTVGIFDAGSVIAGEDESKIIPLPPLVEIIVRAEWTLEEIARHVGMRFPDLVELNELKNDRIYPGQVLKTRPYGFVDEVIVSWYGERFHGKTMSNGEPFDMDNVTTCAHKWLPIGTRICLTRLDTGQSIIVVVRDRGPYIEGRHVDLSRAAAEKFGIKDAGIMKCRIKILSQGVFEDLKTSLFILDF